MTRTLGRRRLTARSLLVPNTLAKVPPINAISSITSVNGRERITELPAAWPPGGQLASIGSSSCPPCSRPSEHQPPSSTCLLWFFHTTSNRACDTPSKSYSPTPFRVMAASAQPSPDAAAKSSSLRRSLRRSSAAEPALFRSAIARRQLHPAPPAHAANRDSSPQSSTAPMQTPGNALFDPDPSLFPQTHAAGIAAQIDLNLTPNPAIHAWENQYFHTSVTCLSGKF